MTAPERQLNAIDGQEEQPLLRVRDLSVAFRGRWGVRACVAVDGVSLDLHAGSVLGVVGMSGSGKSTLARALLRFAPLRRGEIHFEQRNATILRGRALRLYRQKIQMLFQHPGSSLHPQMPVGEIVGEPLWIHRRLHIRARSAAVAELLERVGLDPRIVNRYPPALSGGQQQRVALARCLACEPRILIADEPFSALDVIARRELLELFRDGLVRRGTAVMLISHDLATVERIADRVAVMHAGRIVESGPTRQVTRQPQHEQTKRLWISRS